jgi:outer membrane receptor protein involved in Fe transport
MNKQAFFQTACAICVLTAPVPVFAQAGAGSDEAEIIVTARKREETLVQVPVVAAVFSAQQLDRQQLSTIAGIASQTPDLVTGQSVLELGTQISIRGVGTSASDPGIEQSAALVLDGLQITAGPAFSVGSFDMAQVEVLKGPQALFYGKSSTAGCGCG